MAKRFEDARRYTEKYKDIILPCRYCKSEDVEIVSDRAIFENKNLFLVRCRNCPDCGPENTSVKKAIELWNSDEFRNQTKRGF